ncbi:hypothetical protein HYH03_012883 [Edaphochlamys debaryana]|uniref:Uncharacterized protein n=1 Tax=Edaphochlamys debaryana TaxID=47281 RepID=A0A835XRR9_9CHLO|nr:hypothetical protein HYH03_012883 [Edaphochlamys debaryana]|eukprot:KAG2488564.1 hypothetical protein HYH03_012883 [Edaphochlamys debaryana]
MAGDGNYEFYSKCLTKLFRVNVERAVSDAMKQQRAAGLGRANSARSSFRSRVQTTQSGVGTGLASNLQVHGWSYGRSAGSLRDRPHTAAPASASAAGEAGRSRAPPSYATIPASFMRSPRSAPVTPRGRPQSSPPRTSYHVSGAGGGDRAPASSGGGVGGGADSGPGGVPYGVLTVGPQASVRPSTAGFGTSSGGGYGSPQASPRPASGLGPGPGPGPGSGNMFSSFSSTSGAAPGATAGGALLSPRGRAAAVSNLSLRPSTNHTSEAAAAALQRLGRLAAAIGARNGLAGGGGGGGSYAASPRSPRVGSSAGLHGGHGAHAAHAGHALHAMYAGHGGAHVHAHASHAAAGHGHGVFAVLPQGFGLEAAAGQEGGAGLEPGSGGGSSDEDEGTTNGGGGGSGASGARSGRERTGSGAGGAPASPRVLRFGGATVASPAASPRPVTAPPGPVLRSAPPPPGCFAPPQQLYKAAEEEAAAKAAAELAAARAANSAFANDAGAAAAAAARMPPGVPKLNLTAITSMRRSLGAAAAAVAAAKEARSGADADGDAEGDSGSDADTQPPTVSGNRQITFQGSGEVADGDEADADPNNDADTARTTTLLGQPSARSLSNSPGRLRNLANKDNANADDADDDDADNPIKAVLRAGAAALQAEPSKSVLVAAGPKMSGETNKTLQVGISVGALIEIVKRLGPTARTCSTSEVATRWLLPPTRQDLCRVLDILMDDEREEVLLGEPPVSSQRPTTAATRGSNSSVQGSGLQPVLRPDRTWFGPPDYYVIHAWAGNFVALVAVLKEFCANNNKPLAGTYVWLDVLAVNHHPGRRDRKELTRCRELFARGKQALLVVDAGGEVLTRLWCLYEVWLAACGAPGAAPERLSILNAGADWDTLFDAFFRIDLARAGVSIVEERAKLVEDMVRSTRGSASTANDQPSTTGNAAAVGAMLPSISAAVRSAVMEAATCDLMEARKGGIRGGVGLPLLLDAVERYAMIRRVGGGHAEAEEQLAAAVAAAVRASGGPPGAATAPTAAVPTAQAAPPAQPQTSTAQPSLDSGSGAKPLTKGPGSAPPSEHGGVGAPIGLDYHAPVVAPPPLVPLPADTGGGGGGKAGGSSAAVWRKKPATLAALSLLQVEHGRLIAAMTHASMALTAIPGLSLVRPPPSLDDPDGEGHGRGGSSHGGQHGGRHGGRGGDRRSSHQGDRGAQGRGGKGGAEGAHPPPIAPGIVAWGGPHWELGNPQSTSAGSARAIFMVSQVEAACGRHEAAAQLALQAGLARAAALGNAHPATLATKRAAVPHLLAAGRMQDAQLLATTLLREAVLAHGDGHPSAGVCHGAVAQVLVAQNRPEQAYVAAQRGAEVLAAALGRSHPATLDGLQLCVDILESAQEYGKAVTLMRMLVEGRAAPGAIRASPASPAFLQPNARMLHLRTVQALEEKAAAEDNPKLGRLGLSGILRGLAKLEGELKAALLAMGPAGVQVKKDLETVLIAQNKRYEAALLLKGELPLVRGAAEEAASRRPAASAR